MSCKRAFLFPLLLILGNTYAVCQISNNDSSDRVPVAISSSWLSAQGLTAYLPGGIADGNVSTPGWHTDASVEGAWLAVDLQNAQRVVEAGVYAATAGSKAQCRVQYSDDGSSWTNASGIFAPSLQGWNTKAWSDVGAHRYWRLLLLNVPGPGPWFDEWQLFKGPTTIALRPQMLSQSGLLGFTPEGIVDGNLNTPGWHTDWANRGSWLAIDLGSPRAIEAANLYAATAPPGPLAWSTYSVDFSDDGQNWANQNWTNGMDVVAKSQGWTGVPSDFDQRRMGVHRFWQLLLTDNPWPGPWITEMELYGNPNFRLEPLSASMLSQSGLTAYFPDAIVDGDVNTYGWQTDASQLGAWLQVDLGRPREVVQIQVYSVAGRQEPTAAYVVKYSDDAVSWNETYNRVGMVPRNLGWNVATWSSEGAHRFWRLVLANYSLGSWLSELQLFSLDQTKELLALSPSMLSQSGLSAFTADAIVDGDETNGGWHTDSATAGAWLQVDLGAAREVVQANVYAASAFSTASCTVQYSDDSSTWLVVAAAFVPSRQGRNSVTWPSMGARRYWRLLLENTPGLGPWMSELELISDR